MKSSKEVVTSSGACRHVAKQSLQDRFTRLIVELTLWRALSFLGQPFRSAVAAYLFISKSLWAFGSEFRRLSWRLIGWLAAPPQVPALRQLTAKYFQVKRWQVTIATLLAYTFVSTLAKQWRRYNDPNEKRKRELYKRMATAENYEEWLQAAESLETIAGVDRRTRWKQDVQLYDRKLLEERLLHLRQVRKSGDISDLMFALRADLLRNLGNMTNSAIHEHFPVVPEPIIQFIDEVKECLHSITAYNQADLSWNEKYAYLRETRHAFGRTALVLSGGGSLGSFHVGVVKALYDQNLLPKVLSGSSAGSIVCAIVATKTDEELGPLLRDFEDFDMAFFGNSTFPQFFKHLLLKGTLQDIDVLQRRLRTLLGDMTFLQAYNKTGRILNVAVTAADTNEPPRLLNFLTAPNVIIWSAVACSSAFPYLFSPGELLAFDSKGRPVKLQSRSFPIMSKGANMGPGNGPASERRWRDGSLELDLPMRGLSEMFNVNYFLVSQTNPHIVPFLYMKRGLSRRAASLFEAELKHRCGQVMEVLPRMKWLKVFAQPWEGDITMVLPPTFYSLNKAVTNPSSQDLGDSIRQGERATWKKLSAIQANCGIEIALDECIAILKANRPPSVERRRATPAPTTGSGAASPMTTPPPGLGRKTPSWLFLPYMGMPHNNSTDSVLGIAEESGMISSDAAPIPEATGEDTTADLPAMLDCCDRSVNFWATLISTSMSTDALDVIAP